jgi:cytoskeletal protein RodZ
MHFLKKNNKYKTLKTIGSYLKYTRMNKNISINKMSNDLSLNPSTIVSIENCKHQALFLNVFMIIEYLEIDVDRFYKEIQKEVKLKN